MPTEHHPRIFWLDHVAGMKKLQSLDLDDNVVRLRDRSCLEGMKLSYLQCLIDGSTDMTILEELPSLEMVSLAVVGEMDLTSLLSRENPDIRLRFGREIVEFEEYKECESYRGIPNPYADEIMTMRFLRIWKCLREPKSGSGWRRSTAMTGKRRQEVLWQ